MHLQSVQLCRKMKKRVGIGWEKSAKQSVRHALIKCALMQENAKKVRFGWEKSAEQSVRHAVMECALIRKVLKSPTRLGKKGRAVRPPCTYGVCTYAEATFDVPPEAETHTVVKYAKPKSIVVRESDVEQ